MTNLEIVEKLVEMGYSLFNETKESFAQRFDNDTLKMFLKTFSNYHLDKSK